MNPSFDEILRADAETRSGLYTATAQRLGTTPQNVEKDLWVCWTLDALFNGLGEGPRLLFKGGTSLSKAFGLIERFSEDIDVTVFRDDLGHPASVEELAALSGKKRQAALDEIREACEAFINGSLLERLAAICDETCARTGIEAGALQVKPDPQDRQTLLLVYPSATPTDAYIAKSVKIESGAKSALDPNSLRTITPYVDADVPDIDVAVPNVTVVDAERTFWDKVVILHGLRRWYDIRGQLRGNGQRVSRHYYDVFRLLQSDAGQAALADQPLGEDCVAHARMFFNRPPFDLASAHAPTFALCPEKGMIDDLRQDYRAMSVMIFGEPPPFDEVIEAVADLQHRLNDQA
ncbi:MULTISPECIES: nucleotidyl transferase AbiEii/AbiGii toxin family protein [Sphingomonadales]|uniref:nucleotidyl transferase AbiEii/AbiGii toxin family protein n=1 Tax=Sphingomonadales TaxID=204457 RepID=UPI001EFA3659|nr:nucleotidyl transferase AbiEii/AbiGii toxin family protein [uncultured Croceicoccus sp.]